MAKAPNKSPDLGLAHSTALLGAITEPESSRVASQCAECRRYIAAGVPATDKPSNLLRAFLRYRDWVRSPEIVSLFGAYVAAGYIDLGAPVLASGSALAYPSGCHALEAAVMEGNAGTMVQMVDHGADSSLPTSAAILLQHPEGRGPRNLFELIAAMHSSARVESMTALLIDAVLRRQIASIPTAADDESTPIPARAARRSPGV